MGRGRAIQAASAAGGGTVFFPAGTYLSGTIQISSNVTLWLDAGAVILGSRNVSDYRQPEGERDWYAALILLALMGARFPQSRPKNASFSRSENAYK